MKRITKRRGCCTALMLWLVAGVLVVWGVRGASDRYYRMAYPTRYQQQVERYCREFDVDPDLVYAVIRTESSFRPDATSSIGARGLMQLTEDTFHWVKSKLEPEAGTSYDEMYDPETNIRYGVYLLSALTAQFGSVNNALCAYHAGWGNATAWLNDPEYSSGGEIRNIPFEDTAFYVQKVPGHPGDLSKFVWTGRLVIPTRTVYNEDRRV